jgi:hypothetical protein
VRGLVAPAILAAGIVGLGHHRGQAQAEHGNLLAFAARHGSDMDFRSKQGRQVLRPPAQAVEAVIHDQRAIWDPGDVGVDEHVCDAYPRLGAPVLASLTLALDCELVALVSGGPNPHVEHGLAALILAGHFL